ncbi:hypothetical protein SDC9_178026 [bioreactor metagenome]|uniref:Uncharacterized protein n=1 Tax=bioreactor metagenome TaxID=1076179 RepID=A0A645GUV0_9ZZZZ
MLSLLVRRHHGADALLGKDLKQYRMLDRTVENMRAPYAVADGFEATHHLRDHAAVDFSASYHIHDLILGDMGKQRRRVCGISADAVHIGEEHQLLGV